MTNLTGNDLQQIKDVVVDPLIESMKVVLDTHLATMREDQKANNDVVKSFNGRVTALEKNQGRALKGLAVWTMGLTMAIPTAFGWVKKHVFHID